MVIPFYGADDRSMFAIERAAMDRAGRVIEALERRLGAGRVIDIGAGDGYTAERLTTADRTVVPIEPARGMIDPSRPLPWLQAEAGRLPFADDAFDAAYSTWAYFFPGFHDIKPGLDELHRVVRSGGTLAVVDNAGGDEFSAMASHDVVAPLDRWAEFGFDIEIIDTAFSFESLSDAAQLLRFFFGPETEPLLEVEFRVALMTKQV